MHDRWSTIVVGSLGSSNSEEFLMSCIIKHNLQSIGKGTGALDIANISFVNIVKCYIIITFKANIALETMFQSL